MKFSKKLAKKFKYFKSLSGTQFLIIGFLIIGLIVSLYAVGLPQQLFSKAAGFAPTTLCTSPNYCVPNGETCELGQVSQTCSTNRKCCRGVSASPTPRPSATPNYTCTQTPNQACIPNGETCAYGNGTGTCQSGRRCCRTQAPPPPPPSPTPPPVCGSRAQETCTWASQCGNPVSGTCSTGGMVCCHYPRCNEVNPEPFWWFDPPLSGQWPSHHAPLCFDNQNTFRDACPTGSWFVSTGNPGFISCSNAPGFIDQICFSNAHCQSGYCQGGSMPPNARWGTCRPRPSPSNLNL